MVLKPASTKLLLLIAKNVKRYSIIAKLLTNAAVPRLSSNPSCEDEILNDITTNGLDCG